VCNLPVPLVIETRDVTELQAFLGSGCKALNLNHVHHTQDIAPRADSADRQPWCDGLRSGQHPIVRAIDQTGSATH
jgi:hypothetical protein